MHLPKLWVLAGLLALIGCAKSPPEQQLRTAVAELEQAIEQRDPSALTEALAEDFVGVEGMDREQARRLAQLMFLRHSRISVSTGPLTIRVQGTRASVEFAASVAGGSGAMLPDARRCIACRPDGGRRATNGVWSARSGRRNWRGVRGRYATNARAAGAGSARPGVGYAALREASCRST